MKYDLTKEPLLSQKEFTPSDLQIILEKVKSKYENVCSNINDLKEIIIQISEKLEIPDHRRTKEDNAKIKNLAKIYLFKNSLCGFDETSYYLIAMETALEESNLPPESYSDISDIIEKLGNILVDYYSSCNMYLSASNDLYLQ